MMTLSTLHAHAKKRLADRFGELLRSPHGSIEIHRPVLVRAARRDDQLADPFVVRPVASELVAQPAMKLERPAIAELVAIHQQDVGPLQGPVIGVLVACEHRVDRAAALVVANVCEKGPHLVRLGERADRVEEQPSQERRISGDSRRFDLHLVQLRRNQFVDVAGRRHLDQLSRRRWPRHEHSHHRDLSHVLRRDRRFARHSAGSHESEWIDFRSDAGIAGVGRRIGHVSQTSVRELRRREDLLLRLKAQHAFNGTGP